MVVGGEESEAERKVGGNQGVAIQIVGDRADLNGDCTIPTGWLLEVQGSG